MRLEDIGGTARLAGIVPGRAVTVLAAQMHGANAVEVTYPEDAASMRAIKYLQGFEHKSTEWRAWYGLRSHVESNNQYVKSDAATDLGNPEKRRPRGYAYQALSAAVAFAVSNLRRIVSFIEAKFKAATDDTPKKRQRRRTDEHGVPLPH